MKLLLKSIKSAILRGLVAIDPTLLEPEVLLRPSQFVRVLKSRPSRVVQRLTPHDRSPEFTSVRLAWGVTIRVRPAEFVGAFIYNRGLYDIDVCETIWRLLDAGECAVDVGANIGQMVSLMATKIGVHGRAIAVEPHPEIYQELLFNTNRWANENDIAAIECYEMALSDQQGEDFLRVPKCFRENRGVAALDASGDGRDDVNVSLIKIEKTTLDHMVDHQTSTVGVMKIDVEGHELSVLKGASQLIEQNKIRDIIFEERANYPTAVTQFLESYGYTIFHLSHTLSGLKIEPLAGKHLTIPYFINCLATVDPERALERLATQGWQALGVPAVVGNVLSFASRSAGQISL
ncbi:FkbM family methyltransferase [Myxacorys almedinensis]|uniref:FkbM family methyltransferase n=1 Tax=Myxacorys almedinensis A TaxID=2690445 RepID=A0A8J7Z6H9_9CYAN|nr:FkbM family methyltransferase [Myxacorys almedinensis]NDJ16380.1 FkbM family methyltransferase [Myxacorys almedinensis A]